MEVNQVVNSLTGGGIFAIPSGFAGSYGGYRRRCYRVVARDGKLVSSRLVPVFYLPYGGYRVCRR